MICVHDFPHREVSTKVGVIVRDNTPPLSQTSNQTVLNIYVKTSQQEDTHHLELDLDRDRATFDASHAGSDSTPGARHTTQ